MINQAFLDRAGSCYLRIGLAEEAVRCYRESGAFRKSGDLLASLGRHHDAAADYATAGMNELAGWTLVHVADDPAAARAHLASQVSDTPPTLCYRLVAVRCDIAEGSAARVALPVFDAVQVEFARPDTPHDLFAEQWAVALAELLKRYDQAALTFAAAVRGRKFGAAQRWAQWSARVLHTELIVPAVPVAGPSTGPRPPRKPAPKPARTPVRQQPGLPPAGLLRSSSRS